VAPLEPQLRLGRLILGQGAHGQRRDHHHVLVAGFGAGHGQPDLGQVWVGQGLTGGQNGLARHPGRPQPSDPLVPGPGGEDAPPADGPVVEGAGGLVGVIALGAGLVPQHLDQAVVHPLATEPHLD